MHFSKTLLAAIAAALPEWSLFFVDYKQLKKVAKAVASGAIPAAEFWASLEAEKTKVRRFYLDKEAWAIRLLAVLGSQVEDLGKAAKETGFHREDVAEYVHALVAKARGRAEGGDGTADDDEDDDATSSGDDEPSSASDSSSGKSPTTTAAAAARASEGGVLGLSGGTALSAQAAAEELEAHRSVFVGTKKGLQDFRRELKLLRQFIELNAVAVRKIVKKFAKVAGSQEQRDAYMRTLRADPDFAFLRAELVDRVVGDVDALLERVAALRPGNSKWAQTRVFTVGCFDLAHRGHANLFRALREYGRYLVVGLHDDASYFKLKRKHTVDDLETRIANIKPFCDSVFVIPSTDPTPYLRAMVSEQDVREGTVCFVRGADMPQFPGREYIESVMPVHLLPRSDGVSSSLVRAIYHCEDGEDTDLVQARAMAAAFAPLDDTGKPCVTEAMVAAELEGLQRKRELADIARAAKEAAAAADAAECDGAAVDTHVADAAATGVC
ncbi:hypothetical protein FNF27_03150 [Cafeteria roenbergensis]|uniref:SPX domain-containing protein n=1 Tax=Cafeteria roenbergensis TaxID=33653 RepID=A0A5A8EHR1_CAFRO|nr:hypothetical protein FNF31_03331 [Cafeteria roenbergensis]KAA0175450.1 hypothetical protein FNF27_03150 [Cafeteria roenbergensis]|mmetsp:Transcript_21796/g.82905  ORF Transcript_21796/g.82905 Transcript_21796/m.82905 type:complete len:497 (-) Transcript_21796:2242-3732(-)